MRFCIFDTDLGPFGLGWSDGGISRVLLPGQSREALHERLSRDGAEAPSLPNSIAPIVAMVRAYAGGQRVDFSGVALDLAGVSAFHRRAYTLLQRIGWGEVTTYGAIARQLGDVSLSRAVGQAMGANPIPLVIPCHRVLGSDGKPGGFSAPGGATSKIRMLGLEGVAVGRHDPVQASFVF